MKLESVLCAAISVTSLFSTGYITRAIQERTWPNARMAESKKVVLVYDHRVVLGGQDVDIVTVAPEERVALGLVPLDKQAQLPYQTIMLCKPYNELTGLTRVVNSVPVGELKEISFQCGDKRYLFAHMDIQ